MFDPKMTWKYCHRVNFYECGPALRMKPAALVRVMQQGGEDQLAALGLGYETLLEKHSMAFLLSRMILEIDRMPQNNEEILLETCPMGAAGSQFFRQTNALDGEGNELVRLYTSWTLFDPAARRVLRPSRFPADLGGGTLEIDPREFKLKVEPGTPAGLRPVVYSDLDSNGHMNNAVFLDVVCDLLPLEKLLAQSPRRIRLVYDQQALPGQELALFRAAEGEVFRLSGSQQNRRCFEAEVTF